MAKQKNETRDDLFCPECAAQGMRPLETKAESGRTRYKCVECGFRTTSTLYTQPQILPEAKLTDIRKHRRFLITSAVNDTPIVKGALDTFKRMAEELDACLLIIPGVYKNPDLKNQGVQTAYTWPDEILPYVCNADVKLNNHIVVRGKTRIQYTVINPLTGMNHAGGLESEIYGHPQVAMEIVPTAKDIVPKMLHTTGTISKKNYGDSQRAKKAQFHHSISAVFVEIEGDTFWPTQVHYDGDGAYLFDKFYSHSTTIDSCDAAGVVYGDTHVRSNTKTVANALNNVSNALNPGKRLFHDVHDHFVGSHHNDKNTIFRIRQSIKKETCVRDELNLSVTFLDQQPNAVVVSSNHHEHLTQWFNRFSPHRDMVNSALYFELGHMAMTDIENGGDGDLFRLYLQKYCKKNLEFTNPNKQFMVAGVDCSQHGDRGPNGSRGSARSFSKTGHKTVIGHSHTPGIQKGCYQVGTSSMDLEYAKGFSSWLNTHCIIYKNGKRGLFNIVKNKVSPLMRKMVKDYNANH